MAIILATLAATVSACSHESATFQCAGNDEIFHGEEGPCPATGTLTGVVRAFMNASPSPDYPVTVTLHASGHNVPTKRADADGSFTFRVRPGRFTVTATSKSFGTTCYGRHPVTVQSDKTVSVVVSCSEP